jgi:lipopolysaccharide transport system permease protein
MSPTRVLRRTWSVRDYILATVKRDFVARYRGAQLGLFWAIVQPLATILIYSLVFSEIMRPALPGHENRYAYTINLCAGMLVWQLFGEILTGSVAMFVRNGNLLKKVSVPKSALPAIVTLTGLTNFGLVFGLFIGLILVVGYWPGWAMVALIPVIVIVTCLAVGLGVLLGTINVFYRDVEQAVGMLLNFWFWLTPIVYPARTLPGWLAQTLGWNPLWPLVDAAQMVFLDRRIPDLGALAYPAVLASALLLAAMYLLRRLSGDIVDEL